MGWVGSFCLWPSASIATRHPANEAKIFLDWTVYDPPRRAKIKTELIDILNNDGASENVKEVCEAALAAENINAAL